MRDEEKPIGSMELGCLLFSAPFFIVCGILAILALIQKLT